MKDMESDAEMGVGMTDGHHEGTDGNLDTQFLAYFAGKTLLQRLSILPLAAWQFPQTA